jgi:hypothetical protein
MFSQTSFTAKVELYKHRQQEIDDKMEALVSEDEDMNVDNPN